MMSREEGVCVFGCEADKLCLDGACMHRRHGKKMVHLLCCRYIQRCGRFGGARTRVIGVQQLRETHALALN